LALLMSGNLGDNNAKTARRSKGLNLAVGDARLLQLLTQQPLHICQSLGNKSSRNFFGTDF